MINFTHLSKRKSPKYSLTIKEKKIVSVSTGIKVFVKTLSCASFAMKRLKHAVMQIFVTGQIAGIGMTMPEKFLF